MNERKLTKSELAKREDIIMKMKDNKRALVQKYGKDAEAVMYGRATNLAKKKSEGMDQDKIKEMVKAALMNPVKEDQVEEGNAFVMAADAAKDAGKKEFEFPEGSGKMHPVKIKSDINEEPLDEKFLDPEDFEGVLDNIKFADLSADDVNDVFKEGTVTESKEAGLDELRSIIDQASVLGEEARNIIESYFPRYLRQAEAYGAFSFVESSNPYDTTLASIVDEIENDEDSYEGDDEDMMQEDLDLGHQDNEPHMLKADLYRIGKYAMELYQMVDEFEAGSEEVDFPHWWQSKIIKSKDALVGAKHYLDFEIKEPQIDAMVDVAQEEEAIDENARDKASMAFDKMKVGATIKTSKGEFKKVDDKHFEMVGKPGRKFTAKQMTFIKEESIAEKLAKQLKSK
jgi:hypothetical protein